VSGDFHANESTSDGSESTDKEGEGSVSGPGSHLNGEEEKNSKEEEEDGEENVLLFQESDSSILDKASNLDKLGVNVLCLFFGDFFVSGQWLVDGTASIVFLHVNLKVFHVNFVNEENVHTAPNNTENRCSYDKSNSR
jgi:hypothetical protein